MSAAALNFTLISFPEVVLETRLPNLDFSCCRSILSSRSRVCARDRTFSPGERQRLTDALGISKRAKQRRQAQAYCYKPADGCEVGPVEGSDGIRTPRCAVRAGSIFHSHGDFPLLSNLKPPFTGHRDRFASSKLVRWRCFPAPGHGTRSPRRLEDGTT